MNNNEKIDFSDIFFSPIQVDYPLDESYKENIQHYVQAAIALSHIAGTCIYIFDYVENKFVYFSEKDRMMCGYSVEEINSMGVYFFEKILHPDDMKSFELINKIRYDFIYNHIDPSERHYYWTTCDLRIVTKSGKTRLQNYRFLPFLNDSKGNMILEMAQIDISTREKSGNYEIYSIKENKFLKYDDRKKCFAPVKHKFLSSMEKEVLLLTSKGFTIKEVANKMSIEVFTVNYYTKSILNKLNVSNMKEAVFLYGQRGDLL